MKKYIIIPDKLVQGDCIRIITPARSMAVSWITDEWIKLATDRIKKLGLIPSFGKNISVIDEFDSSPIECRTNDIHEAFSDKSIKMILTVIGGCNSNQLLPLYVVKTFRIL